MQLFSLLLFSIQQMIAPGEYHLVGKRYVHADYVLKICADSRFTLEYNTNRMCFGPIREKISGNWLQQKNTLLLTDTIDVSAFPPDIIERYYGVKNGIVTHTMCFRIRKNGKLRFLSGKSNGGKEMR